MSLREWLILIGALIILGIVLDGIRRMHRARRDSLEISRGMGGGEIDNTPLDDDYNPELPNGGARPANRKGDLPREEPQMAAPTLNEAADIADDAPLVAERDEQVEVEDWEQEEMPSPADVAADEEAPESTPPIGERAESSVYRERRRETGAAQNRPPAGANRPEAQEVVVINVDARPGEVFAGKALKTLFEACGLEHGDLGIYHRHEQDDTRSPVQFSVANAVEPGYFEPASMESMSTPGISFFMSLPGPTDSMQAFDFMLETAQAVVRNLDGELKDERRSVMTGQTIEHCRQRIREYERKRRSVRA
ncbi:cell division protein ZipA [Marinobacteraceae bacterium S3BR75-40.1]